MSFEQFDDHDETLKERRKVLLCGSFFLVILLAFFGMGCYMLVWQIQTSKYIAVESVVADHKMDKESYKTVWGAYSYRTFYYDIVEYEVNGQKYLIECNAPDSIYDQPNDIGNIITIYVDPNNPEEVAFRNSTHNLFTVFCLVVPTIGFVVIGFVFRHAHKLKKRL